MKQEALLQRQVMLALSDAGCTVWRNNTGTAYQGRVIHSSGSTVTLADSRVITFGLCVGSADLIGITGEGRFIALEIKTKTGRVSPDQARFIEHVKLMGGIAGVVRSVDDALKLIHP
jgi:hypothetical protein